VDQFVEKILLDSVFSWSHSKKVFIMELFLRKANKSDQKKYYMFITSWIYKIIQRDFLLLEKPASYFCIRGITQNVLLEDNGCNCNKENCVSFNELASNYFEDKTHLGWFGGIGLGPGSVLLLRSQVRFSLVPIWVG
jgi:hypothetical protein